MKNGIIVGIVIVSLLGLIFVQYHFLRAGLLLERARMDQRVNVVLNEVYLKLVQPNPVREMTLRVLVKDKSPLASPEYLLPEQLKDSLNTLIRDGLGPDSSRLSYAFALTTERNDHLFLATEGYDTLADHSLIYQRGIGGLAGQACDCRPFFRFQVKNTVNYLLGRLAYLTIPSLVFILLLAACLVLLIVYLNRQRRLDLVKNDFINNLTHELKTPVFSIGMLSRMMKNAIEKGQKEKALEYGQLIEKENEVIKGHVERVLELASLDNPNYHMERRPVSFHDLIREAVSGIQAQLLTHQGLLSMRLEAASDLVNVDPVHMKNVLQNLLDNAIKYHKGTPEIELSTRNENGHFIFSISDNGIGIPGDQQDKIFEKFYRVTEGDLHNVKGFGLGLNYVRQIVRAHRGQIRLFSKLGEGSRFEIALIVDK